MAREIRITEQSMTALRDAFLKVLANAKLADGKIKFEHEFGTVDRKATIRFSEAAWCKMQMLISSFDSEIGWDGVVKRGEGDTYIVSDILVCPQTVTGATVQTNQSEYAQWIGSFVDDDEIFPHLRFQGHSHVNMGVTPSGTDTSGWETLLSQLGDDDFYLFMIFNKKGEMTVRLYDYAKNIRFDTADCTVEVEDGQYGLSTFLADAKTKVKPGIHTVTNGAGYSGWYDGRYTGGSYSGYTNGYGAAQAPLNPGPKDVVPAQKKDTAKTPEPPPKNAAAKNAAKSEGWRRKESAFGYDAYDYDGYGPIM